MSQMFFLSVCKVHTSSCYLTLLDVVQHKYIVPFISLRALSFNLAYNNGKLVKNIDIIKYETFEWNPVDNIAAKIKNSFINDLAWKNIAV